MGTRRGKTIKHVLRNAYSCVKSDMDEDEEGIYGKTEEELETVDIEEINASAIVSADNSMAKVVKDVDNLQIRTALEVVPEVNEDIVGQMVLCDNQEGGVIVNLDDEEGDDDLDSFESDFMEEIMEIHNQMLMESMPPGKCTTLIFSPKHVCLIDQYYYYNITW